MEPRLEVTPKAVENFLRLWKERMNKPAPVRPERVLRRWLNRSVRLSPTEREYEGWIIRLEAGVVADVDRMVPLPATPALEIAIPVWNRFIQLHMKHWPTATMPDEAKLIALATEAPRLDEGVRIIDPLIFLVEGNRVKQIARVPKLAPEALTALVDDYGHTPEEATLAAYRAVLLGGRCGRDIMHRRGFDAPYGIYYKGRLYVMSEDVTVLDVVPAD